MDLYFNARAIIVMISLIILSACGQLTQSEPTTTPTPTITPEPTSTPQPEIELNMELPEGDPEAGFNASIRYVCFGCHASDDPIGPLFESTEDLPRINERGEVRMAASDYDGYANSNREYIIESILYPETYLVPGDWEDEMPTHFKEIMSDQDLADIIAWMETFE